MAATAIHALVDRCRATQLPAAIAKLPSGWVIMGERQVLPGYCLLLPDPVVPHLNALDADARAQFMFDMALIGDVLLVVTAAARNRKTRAPLSPGRSIGTPRPCTPMPCMAISSAASAWNCASTTPLSDPKLESAGDFLEILQGSGASHAAAQVSHRCLTRTLRRQRGRQLRIIGNGVNHPRRCIQLTQDACPVRGA